MRKVPWHRVLGLLLASGAFALVAVPSAALDGPDPEQVARDLGLALQRPAAAPVQAATEPPLEPSPQLACGPGSRPESGLQGQVSTEDHESGRAAEGFTCNSELVGDYTKPTTLLETVPGFEDTVGTVGGFKVLRYVDRAGRECAYYDTTLLFPTNVFDALAGVNVLDMSDPGDPVLTERLVTPAMLSPHESLALSQRRGVLAAVAGNPGFHPGVLDLYDVSEDCRHPVLRSSAPIALLGHESGMAPDGRTFYAGSAGGNTLAAVDISDLTAPLPLWAGAYSSHGLSLGSGGDRAYVATTVGALGGQNSVTILDTTEVQARAPIPAVHEIARLQWESMSIPQTAIPVTIDGHPYLIEIDEYGTLSKVGAGRVIDIGNEASPRVVSNLRLEVHQPENFSEIDSDPGASNLVGGYSGHYCNVPRRTDPGIVACSMNLSGLRVFDVRDPHKPREVAYFNAPVTARVAPDGGDAGVPPGASNWAQSSPAFVPKRSEIWYSDGYSGFYAVRITNDAWPADRGEPGGGGTGGGGAGGTGGDGAPDGGGAPAPDADQSDGVAAGAEHSSEAAAGPGSEAGDGGSLPFTGIAVGVLAMAALALLALGVAARRGIGRDGP